MEHMTKQLLEELASAEANVSGEVTFGVSFPLSHVEHARGNMARTRRCKQRMLRVSVLSDRLDEADELAQRMRAWGHSVRKGGESLAALRRAAKQMPDVLLVDVGMPILDGTEFAMQLRLRLPANHCLIIGLANLADAGCRERTVECGIDLCWKSRWICRSWKLC